MVLVNYADKKVTCKIVYCGPGESGKTTNLVYVYNQVDPSTRSELITLEGPKERTLFFDFMSLNLGTIKGFQTTFSLYTVPGQIEYDAARRLILNGVDGIIFVVDSRTAMNEANKASFQNLKENLERYGLSFDTVPLVFQYNKRDLDDILSVDELESEFNADGFPSFEAMSVKGQGVFATLKAISNSIIMSLQ